MLEELTHVLNASFVNYTGFPCDDVSAKLALLSLQHPAAMAIEQRFEQLRKMYEGCPALGYRGIGELLSWDTGRFGGYKGAFIVDKIHSRSVTVRDIVREVPTGAGVWALGARNRRQRNDCCGYEAETASMCPLCKICFCATCFCGGRQLGNSPRCGCWLAYV